MSNVSKISRIGGLLLIVVVAGCGPSYVSGKTQCAAVSDGGARCPDGFVCGNDGTTTTNYCFERNCSATKPFYCANVNICFDRDIPCATVVNCGTSASPSYFYCNSPSQHYDCATSTCVAGAPDAGVKDAASDVKDAAGSDVRVVCGSITCQPGQACLGNNTTCCPAPELSGSQCSVFPTTCGCTGTQSCYPQVSSKSLVCLNSAGKVEGADCRNSSCAAGLGCFGSTCKRYCLADTDCPAVGGVQLCLQTTWSDGTGDIAGVKVCNRVCDPVRPQSPKSPLLACPAGFPCASSDSGSSWCMAPTTPTGTTCSLQSDCAPGTYCAQSGACIKYCYVDTDCATGQSCEMFTYPEYAGAYEVGHCVTPA